MLNEERKMSTLLLNLLDDFKRLKNDKERWEFVIENKEHIMVNLDNDDTFITIIGYEDLEDCYADFDFYIGENDGVANLLDAIGVQNIPV